MYGAYSAITGYRYTGYYRHVYGLLSYGLHSAARAIQYSKGASMIEYRGYIIKHYKNYGLGVFYKGRLITLSTNPVQWIDIDIDYFNSRHKFTVKG